MLIMRLSDLERIDTKFMFRTYDKWPEIAMESFETKFQKIDVGEIDHIISFFESKGGVTAFTFTVNQQYYASPGVSSETDVTSSDELALKVICSSWNKTHDFGDYWSATATFTRVYE